MSAVETARDWRRIYSQNGFGPCPHCFESSGYVWEHGNDWDSGPWSVQTNIPCRVCNGTGNVECEDATDAELFEYFDDALDALLDPTPPEGTRT